MQRVTEMERVRYFCFSRSEIFIQKLYDYFGFSESEVDAEVRSQRDGISVHRRAEIVHKSANGQLGVLARFQREHGLQVWS